jgi:hypothetical protein
MTMTSKKRPKSCTVRAREIRALLARQEWSVDEEVSGFLQGIGAKVLRSGDGRLLIASENGGGRLYESRDEVLSMLKALVVAKPPPPYVDLLPQGREFIDEVPALAERTAELFGIDASLLDRTEASLDHLDRAVRRIGVRESLTPERFPPLTAYVGRVIERATNGRWEARLGGDGVTWEAHLRDRNGGLHSPAVLVFRQLRLGRRGSLRGAVYGSLRAGRLGAG